MFFVGKLLNALVAFSRGHERQEMRALDAKKANLVIKPRGNVKMNSWVTLWFSSLAKRSV